MNAILIYSQATGNGRFASKVKYVVARLNRIFSSVDVCRTESVAHLKSEATKACGTYDVLVFAGGDGTFNHIINAIAKESERPILAYIPAGTLNDFGKNFGIGRSIRKSLDIIERGKIESFDIGLIDGETYFAYVAAIGTFSEISYATKRQRIHSFGRMAYYMNAVKDAIIPNKFDVVVEIDGIKHHHTVPFLLVLNGKYIGGFPVDRQNDLADGKLDVYLTKPGLFNGLLHYLCLKARTSHYRVDRISISSSRSTPWCVDGEEGPTGDVSIACLRSHLRIFSRR